KPPFEPSSDHSLFGSGRVASPSTEKGTIMFTTAPTTGEFITELDELLAQLAVETPFTEPSTDPVDIGEIANWPAHVMPGEPVIVAEIIDDDPAESVDEILEELVAELVEVRWDPKLREHVEVYEVPEAAGTPQSTGTVLIDRIPRHTTRTVFSCPMHAPLLQAP